MLTRRTPSIDLRIPDSIIKREWAPRLTDETRRVYGTNVPVTVFGDYHQLSVEQAPASHPDERSGQGGTGGAGRRAGSGEIHCATDGGQVAPRLLRADLLGAPQRAGLIHGHPRIQAHAAQLPAFLRQPVCGLRDSDRDGDGLGRARRDEDGPALLPPPRRDRPACDAEVPHPSGDRPPPCRPEQDGVSSWRATFTPRARGGCSGRASREDRTHPGCSRDAIPGTGSSLASQTANRTTPQHVARAGAFGWQTEENRVSSAEARQNGEGGIRTPGTGLTPYDGLANRCLQPLGHLSRILALRRLTATPRRIPQSVRGCILHDAQGDGNLHEAEGAGCLLGKKTGRKGEAAR